MKFKGTWIFTLVVVFAVGLAVWDYKKQQLQEEAEQQAAKLLPDFSMSSVLSVLFKGPAGPFELKNQAGEWSLLEPVQDQVDYESLESFLLGIAEQEMSELPVEEPVNWAQYGLDQPEVSLQLSLQDGSTVTVEVGSERAYNEGYYVRKNSENKLYLGAKSWSSYLSKTANDMRNKGLYLGDGDYSGLEILEAKKKIKFDRQEGKWVAEGQKNILISETSLQDYFNLVRHLRADAVVADVASSAAKKLYNLNRPALVISVQSQNDEGASKTWRASFSEPKNNEVFVFISDEKPVYRIQARKMDSLKKDFSYFRNKKYPFTVQHLSQIPAFRLKRTTDKREFMFQRNSGKWVLSVEEPHKKVNEEGIKNLFNDLAGLKVKEFIEGKASQEVPKGKYGLVLLNAMGDVTYEMFWGDEEKVEEDKRHKVWTSVANEAFWVGSDELKKFEAHNLLLPESVKPSDSD